ncbi:Ras GTPase activating protein ira2, partial [Cladochytrium tenue]
VRANTEMDKASSIWFSSDFSFALAGLVLKGLYRSPRMRQATLSFLRTVLGASRRNPPPDYAPMYYVADHCLGYVMALLPSYAGNVKALFRRAGLPPYLLSAEVEDLDESWYRVVLDVLPPFADPNRPLLMVTVLTALLELTEVEAEISLIYGLMSEITLESPETVSLAYETLLPRMRTVLTTSQNPVLIRRVHSIYQTMMASAPQSAPTAPAFLVSGGGRRRASMGSNNSGTSGQSTPRYPGAPHQTHRRSQGQAGGLASGAASLMSAGAGAGGLGGAAADGEMMPPVPLYGNLGLVARLSELGLAGLAWNYMFGNPLVSAASGDLFGQHGLHSLDSRNVATDLAADAVRRLLRAPLVVRLALGDYEVRASVPASHVGVDGDDDEDAADVGDDGDE